VNIHDDLPEDVEALKALALAQREQLVTLNAELCTHAAEIERLKKAADVPADASAD